MTRLHLMFGGLCIVAASSACSLIPQMPKEAFHYFTIEAPTCQARLSRQDTTPELTLERVTAEPAIETAKILYAKSAIERAYYQYSYWVSSPSSQFDRVVRATLECHGIALGSSTIDGPRLALQLHILDFLHDARSEPGTAKVSVSATLFDKINGEEVASTTFHSEQAATRYSAEGAVEGLNSAALEVAEKIASWVERYTKQPR